MIPRLNLSLSKSHSPTYNLPEVVLRIQSVWQHSSTSRALNKKSSDTAAVIRSENIILLDFTGQMHVSLKLQLETTTTRLDSCRLW